MILSLMVDSYSTTMYDKNKLYEKLIIDIGSGDTKALETLYMYSKSDVYGYALSILKNPQNAEDVMQDTYVKLFHAAKSYKPLGKPIAWLMTIVRNQALSKFREKDSNTLSIDNDYRSSSQGDFTENSIDHIVLSNAINKLSDEELQIIILHSVSGLKHREISQIIDSPLATVLSKYHRALAKLKKMMKEEELD